MDLMDILAAYQPRANAPLDEIAIQLGLPGKMGMHGSRVFEHYLQGDMDGIRNYCETDVLNTYLVYLRFEFIRGKLLESAYLEEIQRVKEELRSSTKAHLQEFLRRWEM